jgi:hypothetical protein
MDHVLIKTQKLQRLERIAEISAQQFKETVRLYAILGIATQYSHLLPPAVQAELNALMDPEINHQAQTVSRIQSWRDLLVMNKNLVPIDDQSQEPTERSPSGNIVNIFSRTGRDTPPDSK